MGSKEYHQVKFPQGGGTRSKDFDRNATYATVLKASKDLFFPNGVNKNKNLSLDRLRIFLANYSGDCVRLIDGVEFTVERYRENASVSKGNVPRVYLMSSPLEEESDEENEAEEGVDKDCVSKEKLDGFVEDAFAEFSGDIRMEDVFEWQPESALQEETYSTTLQGRRQLIQQQDEEYRLAVEADQRKEKERESAREKEVLREERKAKVPDEPQIEEEHVVVCVRHLNLGVVTRAFPPNCQMDDVYNWIGSLQDDPQHFALLATIGTQMKTLMHPDENIVPQTMLYMEEINNPVPPATLTLPPQTAPPALMPPLALRALPAPTAPLVPPAPPTPMPPLASPAPMAPLVVPVPPTPTASLVLPAPTAPLTLPTPTAPLAPMSLHLVDNYRTETLDGEENTSFEVM